VCSQNKFDDLRSSRIDSIPKVEIHYGGPEAPDLTGGDRRVHRHKREILWNGVMDETMPRQKKPAAEAPPSADAFLMGIPEVARKLNTTVPAVRALIRSGRLRYVQIGHKMLLSPKAIADFIQQSERYYGEDRSRETDEQLPSSKPLRQRTSAHRNPEDAT
jgi:excisionase family DNA binding protein